MRWWLSVLVLGGALLAGSSARAQGAGDFETCRNAYVSNDFIEAESRFQALWDSLERSGKQTDQLLDVWMYLGASKLLRALRNDSKDPLTQEARDRLKADAGKLFEKVILQKPTYEPDGITFKVSVLDVFTKTKGRLQDVLNQRAIEAAKEKARQEQIERDLKAQQDAYVALLEAQAREVPTVERNSRWLALVPFGVGQYQNGKNVLGTIFFGLEMACIVGTGVTFGIYRYDIGRGADELVAYEGTRRTALLRYQFYTDQAETARLVNLSFVGAAALLMVAGVVEAQINFVTELTTTRSRPLPQKPPLPQRSGWFVPTLLPLVSEQGGFGGQLGVVGTF